MSVVRYANGGSTAFLRARDIEIVFTKTGVKYLHHAALDFDIGVYFEANGHGTVVFSTGFMDRVMSYEPTQEAVDERKNLAFYRLKVHFKMLSLSEMMLHLYIDKHDISFAYVLQACLDLINQAVGDALSDMLLTLVALQVSERTKSNQLAVHGSM